MRRLERPFRAGPTAEPLFAAYPLATTLPGVARLTADVLLRCALLQYALLQYACLAALPAQALPLDPPNGYQSRIVHRVTASPFALNGFAVDPRTGVLYVSESASLLAIDRQGRPSRIHEFANRGHTAGLVAADPNGGRIFFTNFQTHELLTLGLEDGEVHKVGSLKNAFDLTVTKGGRVLVAANPDWPGPGAKSGIYAMDLATGKHRRIIDLDGPSGPLCLDPVGQLLYAVQSNTFPTPKGAVRIVAFSAARLNAVLGGGKTLTLEDGKVVLSGLDGATGLAFDHRARLYVSDASRGGLLRTSPGTMQLESPPFVAAGKLKTIGLQCVRLDVPSMDGWQPDGSAQLFVSTSDWSSTAEVRRVEPRRPRLVFTPGLTVPKGPLRIDVSAAPANATAWFGFGFRRLPREVPAFVDHGITGWVGLDRLAGIAFLARPTDAKGAARLDLANPGGHSFEFHLQVLTVGSDGFGTSSPVTLSILK